MKWFKLKYIIIIQVFILLLTNRVLAIEKIQNKTIYAHYPEGNEVWMKLMIERITDSLKNHLINIYEIKHFKFNVNFQISEIGKINVDWLGFEDTQNHSRSIKELKEEDSIIIKIGNIIANTISNSPNWYPHFDDQKYYKEDNEYSVILTKGIIQLKDDSTGPFCGLAYIKPKKMIKKNK